ncbi:MAG TPA: alpha/beta hydrolase [Candidatus Udaeobacter sp.]|nr:alpha/beta hydrolase [Candidatus Udaeobacter sp.]
MKINSLEKININGSEQWVLIRGKSTDAPLLIHVQAGPGLPIIPEADTMEKLLHLENNFLVAYWDQRGCGKSFNEQIDPKSINFSQLSKDVISCTQYLLKKYNKKDATVVGYSVGATVSLMAAAEQGSLFSELFLVGLDIDIPTANVLALDFAMQKAKEVNNKKIIKKIEDLKKNPIIGGKRFQQRAKILTDFGGIRIGFSYAQLLLSGIKNMLFSKFYKIGDIVKTIRGMEFCQNALMPEFNMLNLFKTIEKVDASVHFINGKHDAIAPYEIAVKFYNHLQARKKEFITFEHSAHFPNYDEPEKFSKVLIEHALGK